MDSPSSARKPAKSTFAGFIYFLLIRRISKWWKKRGGIPPQTEFPLCTICIYKILVVEKWRNSPTSFYGNLRESSRQYPDFAYATAVLRPSLRAKTRRSEARLRVAIQRLEMHAVEPTAMEGFAIAPCHASCPLLAFGSPPAPSFLVLFAFPVLFRFRVVDERYPHTGTPRPTGFAFVSS